MGKELSQETLERIAIQKSMQGVIKRQREQNPENRARKIALELFYLIKSFGSGVNNDGEIMIHTLVRKVFQEQPIEFVGFWGVGDKHSPDRYDHELMKEHQDMIEAIQNGYPYGAKTSMILADVHGQFNGYRHLRSDEYEITEKEEVPIVDSTQPVYLEQIQRGLSARNIASFWLSDLYLQYGITIPDDSSPVEENLEAHHIFSQYRQHYTNSAKLRSKNGLDPEQAAKHYVKMRLGEREMLLKAFPCAILVVNGTKMTAQPLMPQDMPILYSKHGPAWFKNEESMVQ